MTTLDRVIAIPYQRYGVLLDDSRKIWYYTPEQALRAAVRLGERGIPCKFLRGTLVNDEGCTPWIRTDQVLEAL